jgi:hypothetical protein
MHKLFPNELIHRKRKIKEIKFLAFLAVTIGIIII